MSKDPHNEAGKFYSYEKRQGILPISWEDYFGLCKGQALAISAYDPEIIRVWLVEDCTLPRYFRICCKPSCTQLELPAGLRTR
jgi:hypothetical protein